MSSPALENEATVEPKLPRWQRFFGVRRREGRFLRWGLTKLGWCWAVFLIMGVGMAGFGEYSMQPAFCRSCHIMEPYYQAWHESKHKNVPCVDCHFEPGVQNTLYGKFQASSQAVKYVTATYGSKPHAEIRDVSCLREGCHEKRLLEGKVHWTVHSETGQEVTIRFDHTPHLQQERRGKQLRCVSCHSQIVQGKHIVVTTDTCFLCHFKGVKHGRDDQTIGTCRGCHDAPKNEIKLPGGMTYNHTQYVSRGVKCENCHSDAIKGDGAVPQQVCWNCHNQPAQIARYGETNAMHKEHVTLHKVECSSCHVQIEHGLNAGSREEQRPGNHLAMDPGACGQCHEQMHLGPKEMFRGVGGRGVPDMPSPMSRVRVNCIACHQGKKVSDQVADVAGQTYLASQERCDYCHGDKYKGLLADWKKTLAAQTDKAEAAYVHAKAALARQNLGAEDLLRVQRLLDDAEHNLRFVKLGYGVHNINYATALLNVTIESSHQAEAVVKDKGVPKPATTMPEAGGR